MGASCLDTFDVSAAAPRAPAVRGLLTTCPRNGLSNQLLALLSAAAVASDLGVGFWIPPLLVDNLQGPRAGASGAERVSFCASCYAALAQAETSPLAEVLNVTAFEAVGGVQLVAGGLPASFARGAVLDVCVAQHYELAIGESPCARDETWSSPTNWATPGPLDALPRRARGEAAYSCLRDATAGMLANTSTAAPKLWIKFGSSVQEYYQLCGRPPIVLPPFFELSREVVAVGAGVWPLLLRGLRDALRDRAYRACAHVRLSLPGEGWDQLGSPFTEAVPAQVHSFRDWLRRVLTKGRMPVLILSDAPWLLQRVVPELDDCLVTGRCALADLLVDELVHARPVSQHFRSVAAQLACASSSSLLLTPKSSFSKMIRMLASRHQAVARTPAPSFAYTRARVRFHAPLALMPFLRRARTCAGLLPQARHRECLVRLVADAILVEKEGASALSLQRSSSTT